MEGRQQADLLVSGRLDILKRFNEVSKDLSRHHDGVSVTADIFRDFHDASALVFFEIEKEDFSISENFLCM